MNVTLLSFALGLVTASTTFGQEWTDLGCADPGTVGDPKLEGDGILEPGETVSLNLSQANPSTLAMFFISPFSNPVPLGGGLLKAFPVTGPPLAIPLVTSLGGNIPITGTVPALPLGIPFYFQYAIADQAASQGIALSNAVRAYSPSVAPEIDSFSPVSGGEGTAVTVDGEYFGNDPDDLCVLLVDQGEVVGFARAKDVDDEQFELKINTVVPGATTGILGMVRGQGDTTTPVPPNAGFVLDEDPWVFIGEGAPTMSTQVFNFTTQPSFLAGCSTIYGQYVVEDNEYRLKLPFTIDDLCSVGTTYSLDFHAGFTDGNSIHVDYIATLENTTEVTGGQCADAICDMYNAKMDDYLFTTYGLFPLKYKIKCDLHIIDGEIFLVFDDDPAPSVDYTDVWFYLKVCP